jgi:transglutaminase/protease-like cytokinesis protein 3
MLNSLLFAILLITDWSYGNTNNCDDGYVIYDERSFELGTQLCGESSFHETVSQIQHLSNSETSQLWIVAGWMYKHMNFDMDKFIRGGPVKNFESIYQRRTGICGEYASLFSEFCNELGIKNHVIEGYAPELSNNTEFVETNHAWNVVQIGDCWYHCDLQGLSGKLYSSKDGDLSFKKQADPFSFLARDDYFLSKHIPADPMWQLKKHPQEMNMLLSSTHLIKEGSPEFMYVDSIQQFDELSDSEQKIKFAQNAHKYNPNNHNVVVINYYNEAVDLIQQGTGDKSKLGLAMQYLSKAKEHVSFASNGVQELKPDIDKALDYLSKYLP